jgi:hypothetical protein
MILQRSSFLTGAIERLDEAGEKDYFRVVRHRSSFPDSSAGSGVSRPVTLEAGLWPNCTYLP